MSKRRRFVDRDGNYYAPSKASDSIVRLYRQRGKRLWLYRNRARGPQGPTIMFAQLRRGRSVVKYPRGEIELLDLETLDTYVATIDIRIFIANQKSGHVLLSSIERVGRSGDPKKFIRARGRRY